MGRVSFVLIHSPLVGPLTWSLVADELRAHGRDAIVPALLDTRCERGPYWQRHADAVAPATRGIAADRSVVLVAHSGAGPLLPAIGQALGRAVQGYLFVDAALPGAHGQSRLDLFDPEEAERFRAAAVGGMIPAIFRNDAVLRAAGIADDNLRRRFAAEVPHVPLAVYEEPLSVPASWPDAPGGYLLFSAPYEPDAQRARSRGWPVRELRGGHFHMLSEPNAVADALLELTGETGI